MNDNEKLYKVYHRNYQNIMELYDDLSDAVLNIGLENNRIIIHYNSDTLEIENSRWCYYTYLNGKREKVEWEDQDIYFYALEFVHEQRKDVAEIEVHDTSIIDVNAEGIVYTDEFGRKHTVSYNFLCGEQNQYILRYRKRRCEMVFKVCTSDVLISFVFARPFVLKKRNRFLFGSKKKRFGTLQKAIRDSGYTI